ncbi:MAG TPA: YidB family protein [Dongiaceae bacterium]|nr:YidB family protein [Dongiaceae bacterium]
MGLLDEVLSMAGAAGGAQSQQHAGALGALLNYINSPQVGGITGLQQIFQQKGLGGLMSSWIGTGQNLPISADQLQNVLHSGALQDIAAKTGMDQGQLTSVLSQLLPHVVDKLTPNGQVPDSNVLSQMMKGLAAGQS